MEHVSDVPCRPPHSARGFVFGVSKVSPQSQYRRSPRKEQQNANRSATHLSRRETPVICSFTRSPFGEVKCDGASRHCHAKRRLLRRRRSSRRSTEIGLLSFFPGGIQG